MAKCMLVAVFLTENANEVAVHDEVSVVLDALRGKPGVGILDWRKSEHQSLADDIERLTHERSQLAIAIQNAAVSAGICRPDVPLAGPQLLILCNDMATELQKHYSESANSGNGDSGEIEFGPIGPR